MNLQGLGGAVPLCRGVPQFTQRVSAGRLVASPLRPLRGFLWAVLCVSGESLAAALGPGTGHRWLGPSGPGSGESR